MVIVRLIGGLGNQMFEYAMARALACRLNAKLKIDRSWIKQCELEKGISEIYGLKHFDISQDFATTAELAELMPQHRWLRKIFLLANRYLPYCMRWIMEEKKFEFDSHLKKLKPKIYFYSGYWQSYKYFEDIRDVLLKDFSFKDAMPAESGLIAAIIEQCESVSIHIRRGDYACNPVLSKIYNTFGIEYYDRAIAHVASQIADPVFFVFSDDIEWVKQNLNIPYKAHYVINNIEKNEVEIGHKSKGYEDLRLMMMCKHNIIANSSFSWWAAWLNNNPDKIVITPKKWFNDSRKIDDLIPPSWIRL